MFKHIFGAIMSKTSYVMNLGALNKCLNDSVNVNLVGANFADLKAFMFLVLMIRKSDQFQNNARCVEEFSISLIIMFDNNV